MLTDSELPPLPNKAKLYTAMPDDYRYGHVYGYTADQMHAYARAAVNAALEQAAQECRIVCGKNHADAATFKSGTKAYVQGCDDCADAIRALMKGNNDADQG